MSTHNDFCAEISKIFTFWLKKKNILYGAMYPDEHVSCFSAKYMLWVNIFLFSVQKHICMYCGIPTGRARMRCF